MPCSYLNESKKELLNTWHNLTIILTSRGISGTCAAALVCTTYRHTDEWKPNEHFPPFGRSPGSFASGVLLKWLVQQRRTATTFSKNGKACATYLRWCYTNFRRWHFNIEPALANGVSCSEQSACGTIHVFAIQRISQAPEAIAPSGRRWKRQQYPLLILYKVCAIEQSLIFFFHNAIVFLFHSLYASSMCLWSFMCHCYDICIKPKLHRIFVAFFHLVLFHLKNQFTRHRIRKHGRDACTFSAFLPEDFRLPRGSLSLFFEFKWNSVIIHDKQA